jgi:hypothetical protein
VMTAKIWRGPEPKFKATCSTSWKLIWARSLLTRSQPISALDILTYRETHESRDARPQYIFRAGKVGGRSP